MFQEDMDQEKHNKLNDIFQALERLRDEYEELEQMDSDMGSSGVGDLTDQLTTMRKHMSGLYKVLDRATKIVPMNTEGLEGETMEAKPDYIDIDGDGDKEEPMKKAVKDKEKKSDDEKRESIKEEVTISGSAEEIMRMMQLAGNADADDMGHRHDEPEMGSSCGSMSDPEAPSDMDMGNMIRMINAKEEEDVEDGDFGDASTTPADYDGQDMSALADLGKASDGGDGIGRAKKMYPPADRGDNPMALETSIKEQLWAALNAKLTTEGRGRGRGKKKMKDDINTTEGRGRGRGKKKMTDAIDVKTTEGRGRGRGKKMNKKMTDAIDVKTTEGRGRGRGKKMNKKMTDSVRPDRETKSDKAQQQELKRLAKLKDLYHNNPNHKKMVGRISGIN